MDLDEVKRAILKALSTADLPLGCGEIGKLANLPTPKVMGNLRGLAKEELVSSSVKGKYIITEKGRNLTNKLPP